MGYHYLQPTWVRGELSPLAHGRGDTELYQQGAETILNWFVLKEGGLRRRSGTRYRGAAKFHNKDTRLVDFKLSAALTFAIELGDLYARFWTNGGQITSAGSPYEIVSPYAESALRSLKWAQAGSVLYIAHRSMTVNPKRLVRTSDTSWAFSDVEFRDGPYLAINDQQNLCTPSAAPATGSTSTLSFANTNNINGGAGFQTTDVGRQLRAQFNGKWSWGVITTRNSTTEVVVTWSDGQGGTTPSLSWRLGAFSDTTGYPGSVAIFQGRVFWGNTPSNPRYIGYSYSGLPDTFSPSEVDGTVTDAHGGFVDIVAGDEVLWMQEAPRLQIGTPSAIRSLGAQDIDQTFGPRNVLQKMEMPEGVSDVNPVVVGSSTIHTSRFSTSINDLYFDYQVNSLVNPELSVASEHLVFDGVTELAFAQIPNRRLFAIVDGGLVSTTVDKYEKVAGFSRHDVDGDVISCTAISGTRQHDLWMVVRREIDGAQKQYIETLDPDFLRGSVNDAFFSDCGGTYSGSPTNTITGITWLPNTEVSILADGRVLANATVSAGGVLTLPGGINASKVQFGLPMQARAKLLRAQHQTSGGAALGRRVKVVSAEVDVYETRGLKVISDRGKTDELRERPGSNVRAVNGLLTGTFRIGPDGSWTSQGQLEFYMDVPLPATVRAVNVQTTTED